MDKMNGKFFKYTLILLAVAIVFIIIGGISVSRVDEYVEPEQTIEVSMQEYEDIQKSNERMSTELQGIVDVLHTDLNDTEKVEQIKAIIEE